jgi:HK97 family phage portal protein
VKVDLLQALADSSADISKAANAGVSPSQFIPTGGLNQPVRADWDHARADRDGFKTCSWVYACIDRLSGACSSVPWRMMEKKGKRGIGKGEWEPNDDSPYTLAIEYPNDIMSRQFMMAAGVQHLGIGGNALWKNVSVTRAGGRVPSEFWPLNPNVYRPIPDELKWISGYKRRDKPYETPLEVSQVIHAQFPDPANLIWGLSPMRAIARVIDMDVEHVKWNAALPGNRMTPETAIVDRNLKTDTQLDEAADRLAERYSGPDRAGRPLMLGAGAEVLRLSLTPQEMGWIESRRFTLIEICAAYGLIPSLFVPDAKYSNQDVAVKYMWENGATRMLSVFEDAFNTRLIPRALRSKLWIHFDLSGVPAMSDSLEKRLEAHERAVRSAIPPNQSFVIFDIPCPPVEGGDKPLVLGTLVPLEQVVAEPDTSNPEATEGGAGQGEQDQGPGGDGGNGADSGTSDGASAS